MTSNFYDTPITTDEYELMLKTVSERLKNIVYATAYDRTRMVLDKMGLKPGMNFLPTSGERTVTVSFPVVFIENDLVEIVAGMRRMEEAVEL